MAFATNVLQLKSTYVDCGQRSHICFWLFLQTALNTLHLSCVKNFQSLITVNTKHVSVVLMMASCDTLFWNIFEPLHLTSSWKTTQYTVPPPMGSWRLSWWVTVEHAIVTVDVYMPQHTAATNWELCEIGFKLVLPQLTLTCCSMHRLSLNIAWTLYMWQMVPMLNVCNVQNTLWDFLSQMMTNSVSLSFHTVSIQK
jgi:hypothetical protein